MRAFDGFMNAERKGKRYRLFELPTGAGKSPIAITLGAWSSAVAPPTGYKPGAYILTTQKTLQSQYMRDFAQRGLVELKGAANYHCSCHDTNCSEGSLLNKAAGPEVRCDNCPYAFSKREFMRNKMGVTNFSYFLSETRYVGKLQPRATLIIDEAHNAESQILSMVEIELTQRRAQFVGLTGKIPVFKQGNNDECRVWLSQKFMPLLAMKLESCEAEAAAELTKGDKKAAVRAMQVVNGLETIQEKLNGFLESENKDDWFIYMNNNESLCIKPLSAAKFAEDVLLKFGSRVVFMSATILDANAFARSLGLDKDLCGFMRAESEFPIENRLIHYYPTGSMGYKDYDATLPKLLARIKRVLDKHANDKGIIHVNSYKLQEDVKTYFAGTPYEARLVFHTNVLGSRDEALQIHHDSPLPTVLVSPSMTEGLDLKDDLSRFQIIAKVPYPSLGDAFIKARMERDPKWYTWQTALTLMQATGRSIRSANDHATTYILDSGFSYFLTKAGSILPKWWLDSIVFHS